MVCFCFKEKGNGVFSYLYVWLALLPWDQDFVATAKHPNPNMHTSLAALIKERLREATGYPLNSYTCDFLKSWTTQLLFKT